MIWNEDPRQFNQLLAGFIAILSVNFLALAKWVKSFVVAFRGGRKDPMVLSILMTRYGHQGRDMTPLPLKKPRGLKHLHQKSAQLKKPIRS